MWKIWFYTRKGLRIFKMNAVEINLRFQYRYFFWGVTFKKVWIFLQLVFKWLRFLQYLLDLSFSAFLGRNEVTKRQISINNRFRSKNLLLPWTIFRDVISIKATAISAAASAAISGVLQTSIPRRWHSKVLMLSVPDDIVATTFNSGPTKKSRKITLTGLPKNNK